MFTWYLNHFLQDTYPILLTSWTIGSVLPSAAHPTFVSQDDRPQWKCLWGHEDQSRSGETCLDGGQEKLQNKLMLRLPFCITVMYIDSHGIHRCKESMNGKVNLDAKEGERIWQHCLDKFALTKLWSWLVKSTNDFLCIFNKVFSFLCNHHYPILWCLLLFAMKIASGFSMWYLSRTLRSFGRLKPGGIHGRPIVDKSCLYRIFSMPGNRFASWMMNQKKQKIKAQALLLIYFTQPPDLLEYPLLHKHPQSPFLAHMKLSKKGTPC